MYQAHGIALLGSSIIDNSKEHLFQTTAVQSQDASCPSLHLLCQDPKTDNWWIGFTLRKILLYAWLWSTPNQHFFLTWMRTHGQINLCVTQSWERGLKWGPKKCSKNVSNELNITWWNLIGTSGNLKIKAPTVAHMNNWGEFINNMCAEDTWVLTDFQLSMSRRCDRVARILIRRQQEQK